MGIRIGNPNIVPNCINPATGVVAPCVSCPNTVRFEEHPDTKYGFDDFTDAAKPWKSVEIGEKDKVNVVIAPADAAKLANTKFESSDETIAKVSPSIAGSGNQTLEIQGIREGETTIKAICDGSEKATLNIVVYPLVEKTVAIRLVHETHYRSTDVADAEIIAFLKKVYNQAVFKFKVTRLPAKTVAFDLNGDGKIDVDPIRNRPWITNEMQLIINACRDTSYDYNIFIVDNPSDGSYGYMGLGQRYGFVHLKDLYFPGMDIAHELGHGAFRLTHTNATDPVTDPVNVMSQGDSDTKWRLRKDQWDQIQR